MTRKSLARGFALCAILLLVPAVRANGPTLHGAWIGEMKCEGLEGPDTGMPGGKVKAEHVVVLSIAQGESLAGALAPKALDVMLWSMDIDEPAAAWCGWMNTSNDDMTKGQGSLGPFARYQPVSLSHLFYNDPPPPFSPVNLAFGDSTMHIKKWELVHPDAFECDAKLEAQGAMWIPGGAAPLGGGAPWGGSRIFATCAIKAKRCPFAALTPFTFCENWGPPS